MYIVVFLNAHYEAIGTDRTYNIPNLLVNVNLVQTNKWIDKWTVPVQYASGIKIR
jgi:hypothetical protein